ncbi:hypothetical protein DPMN_116581 [Dreissena polymorpha]|uniref:Uncharacterized protein n=1 Tax=Dreissena polymorpha TaxID=45954 RepID=A0A9D4QTN9_DREPO|nr:hypothetical protein DPMN_116581 [Dreissena polymorpha]
MEKELDGIQSLDKMTDFKKEIRQVWVVIEDSAKVIEERVNRLEDMVELVNKRSTLVSTRVSDLERQRDELQEEVPYLLRLTRVKNNHRVGSAGQNLNSRENSGRVGSDNT